MRDSISIKNAAGDTIVLRHQTYMGDGALLIAPGITATVRMSTINPDKETSCLDMGNIHLHGVMPEQQKRVTEWVEQIQRARAI